MILITGAARSGTSLTAQILQAHGCWLGDVGSVNVLFENHVIRERILKPIFDVIGADRLGQNPLPRPGDVKPVQGLRERVEMVLNDGPKPWAYKDAKLCLVWQAWAAAFPEAKWVIVRRDASAIVESCMRAGFMRAYSSRAGWRSWVAEHERRFEAMKAALGCIEVWPADYIADVEAFRPVAEFCGLDFKPDAVRGAIKRDAWHG